MLGMPIPNSNTTDDSPYVQYTFTEKEVARLSVYRAAVRAEFYTDKVQDQQPKSAPFPYRVAA